MEILSLQEIQAVLDKTAVMDAVRQGFISHDLGDITSPMPMGMLFRAQDHSLVGDCHVKSAYSDRYPYFCVKIATGFYNNPSRGLDANNGLVLLMSSDTGAPLALFLDDGHLTAVRTAAAGALAASLTGDPSPKRLGIIGTGEQAEMQSRWIADYIDLSRITVFGRSSDKANGLIGRLDDLDVSACVADTPAELCAQSDIIVTTTTATSPVLMSTDIKPGHHIVAMGADSLGKTEVDPEIFALADVIVVDDHGQCLDHGEFGSAVRAGLVDANRDVSLGAILAGATKVQIGPESVSIVDLTGLGAQDLAVASLVFERLKAAG